MKHSSKQKILRMKTLVYIYIYIRKSKDTFIYLPMFGYKNNINYAFICLRPISITSRSENRKIDFADSRCLARVSSGHVTVFILVNIGN